MKQDRKDVLKTFEILMILNTDQSHYYERRMKQELSNQISEEEINFALPNRLSIMKLTHFLT
jgi:hypothetical protein